MRLSQMVRLIEKHKIKILKMIFYDENTQIQMEVACSFNEKFKNLPHISQGIISKIVK